MTVLRFDRALRFLEACRHKHLLLGNGFSMALDPNIFSYGSLYEQADFGQRGRIRELFDTLETRDFELVIRHLLNSAKVVEVYRPNLVRLAARIRDDAATVKTALVNAVARHHPDRPYNIDDDQYRACRAFLFNFDHIFSLNYDITLYWALMNEDVDDIDLRPDDGFRHPEDDPELPWVSWQQSHSAKVHYLHGALHLFDQGTDIIKYTWSKTDIPLIEQIRSALDEEKYPVFVAEGTSRSKKQRILHNAYLHKALRSFESCCNPQGNGILVYGHSLADNDLHVLRMIAKGAMRRLAIGVYGDPDALGNRSIMRQAAALQALRREIRGERTPLEIVFFDAATAEVWG